LTPEYLRSVLPSLPRSAKLQVAELLRQLEERDRRAEGRKLRDYRPYPKQLEFHRLGATVRERLLMAANQSGKSLAAAAEIAYHTTGAYPDWWEGYRFTKPNVGWAASESMEVSRDAGQRLLLGRATARGTGTIPRESIAEISPYPNVKDAISVCKIRHVSGGFSQIFFKSYDQGRRKFQGDTIDWGWCDEEPPPDIYSELLTRTNVGRRPVFTTFTPLQGVTDVVMSFMQASGSVQKALVTMTLDDVEHYTEEEKAAIIASYPEHEREARTKGIPIMGSGRVFPVPESLITEGPIQIPAHWPRIAGIDFGWDHPTAIAWLAWDRDNDVLHLYDAYRQRHESPVFHAEAARSRGPWIPMAWPHDGNNDTAAGEALAKQYRERGVNMLKVHATHPAKPDGSGGGNSVEAGVMEMLNRMQTGRFKVASHLTEWFEEFRLYHRKDGKLVKERDDLLSASRYAQMMLRHALTKPKADMSMFVPYAVLDSETGY
jgi:phage terminase large subunit-like protein